MEAMAVCEGSGARRTAFGHGLAMAMVGLILAKG
jgi:hypothetical protein